MQSLDNYSGTVVAVINATFIETHERLVAHLLCITIQEIDIDLSRFDDKVRSEIDESFIVSFVPRVVK